MSEALSDSFERKQKHRDALAVVLAAGAKDGALDEAALVKAFNNVLDAVPDVCIDVPQVTTVTEADRRPDVSCLDVVMWWWCINFSHCTCRLWSSLCPFVFSQEKLAPETRRRFNKIKTFGRVLFSRDVSVSTPQVLNLALSRPPGDVTTLSPPVLTVFFRCRCHAMTWPDMTWRDLSFVEPETGGPVRGHRPVPPRPGRTRCSGAAALLPVRRFDRGREGGRVRGLCHQAGAFWGPESCAKSLAEVTKRSPG